MRLNRKFFYYIYKIKIKLWFVVNKKWQNFNIKLFSKKEFISTIEHKSFVRFGDGEAVLLMGGDIYFQNYNKQLAKQLKECMKSDRLIKCYHPNIFNNRLLKGWRENLFYFFIKHHKGSFVGDAMSFRAKGKYGFDIELLNIFFTKLKKYYIILVHNDEQNKIYLENVLKKEVKYVKIPKTDAYDKKDEILQKIKQSVVDAKYKNFNICRTNC